MSKSLHGNYVICLSFNMCWPFKRFVQHVVWRGGSYYWDKSYTLQLLMCLSKHFRGIDSQVEYLTEVLIMYSDAS